MEKYFFKKIRKILAKIILKTSNSTIKQKQQQIFIDWLRVVIAAVAAAVGVALENLEKNIERKTNAT